MKTIDLSTSGPWGLGDSEIIQPVYCRLKESMKRLIVYLRMEPNPYVSLRKLFS